MSKLNLSMDQIIRFENLFSLVTILARDRLELDREKEEKSKQAFFNYFFMNNFKTQKDAVKDVLLFQKWISIHIPGRLAGAAIVIISDIFISDDNTIDTDSPQSNNDKNPNEDNKVINLSDRRK